MMRIHTITHIREGHCHAAWLSDNGYATGVFVVLYKHVKGRAVAGIIMLFGCKIMVTAPASLLCYTHHANAKDRAVAGIVMLFGCHSGHAIGVFVVLYTCCCERPCHSGNRVQLQLITLLNFDTAAANEMYPLS